MKAKKDAAAAAVQRYLDQQAKMGGLDHEFFSSLNVGAPGEAHLTRTDLQALLDENRTLRRQASPSSPQGRRLSALVSAAEDVAELRFCEAALTGSCTGCSICQLNAALAPFRKAKAKKAEP
jgi:hypothetical protein